MGLAAFGAQISPKAKLFSHPLMRPQTFPGPGRDVPFPIPAHLMMALKPWIQPDFLTQPSPLRLPAPSLTIWTDASLQGYGAHSSLDQVCWGIWEEEWKNQHINVLELKTVQIALREMSIVDTVVLIATDNSTTVAAINKMGSTASQIHKVALELFAHCEH